jgi:hypothetical protein
MYRTCAAAATLGLMIALQAPATAQFPDDVPPPRPQGVNPGDLNVGSIQRGVRAFEGEASRLAPTRPAPAMTAAPTPHFGYIHQFGSFEISPAYVDTMFMLTANLPFPDGRRSVDFYHATLGFEGRYTDPASGISGYVYSAAIGPPVNDRRYFLFGDRNLNVADPNSNGTRWVIYYNGAGKQTFATTARFYMP